MFYLAGRFIYTRGYGTRDTILPGDRRHGGIQVDNQTRRNALWEVLLRPS